MEHKKTKHEFRANTLPALITVGPVTLIMVLLIAVPLIYVAVMSFCSIDEFYNVTFKFTLQNYVRLANADYLKIYAQSIAIALITTIICILVGYPFSYIIARTKIWMEKFSRQQWIAEWTAYEDWTCKPACGFFIQAGNHNTWYGLLPDSIYDTAPVYSN